MSGLTNSQAIRIVHHQTTRVSKRDMSPVPILSISAINGIIFAIMTMSQKRRLNPMNIRSSPTHRRIQAMNILSLFALVYICSIEAFPYWRSAILMSLFVLYETRLFACCCHITLTSAGYTAENETRRSPISGTLRLPLAIQIYTALFSMLIFEVANVFLSFPKILHFWKTFISSKIDSSLSI